MAANPNPARKTLRHVVFAKRAIALSVSSVLAVLMLTSALPPLVADQSDRAILNAPIMLVTAPIAGDVASFAAQPGVTLEAKSPIAEIVNNKIDRSTLIMLDGKESDTRENIRAATAKINSDNQYIRRITDELERQTTTLVSRYQDQIKDLQAQVGSANASLEERKLVVTRQTEMVQKNVFAPSMATTASHQSAVASFEKQTALAKLAQKQSQLKSLQAGIFVGDDVQGLAVLLQKKRDLELDVQRLTIERVQSTAALDGQTRLLGAERDRLDRLSRAVVEAPARGEILNVGASLGRHVNAGDTLARVVDCDASFVVAIFSYRQASNLAVGSAVTIDSGFGAPRDGVVSEILPKSSDKADEAYAVPFPQTERRELYVLVRPTSFETNGRANQCDIGRWVTVSRSGGWIPATSVAWRALQNGIVSVAESFGLGRAQALQTRGEPFSPSTLSLRAARSVALKPAGESR